MRKEYTYNFKQQSLYWHTLEGTSTDKGVIVFIHGLGDHSRRYDEWFEGFAKQGFAIVSIDLPGHGRSTGIRGHIDHFDDYMRIIDFIVSKAEELFPNKPILLYGHSMGGNLVTNYLLEEDYSKAIQGSIITSPWYALSSFREVFITPVARMLNTMSPKLRIKSKIKLSDLLFLSVLRKRKDQKDEYAHRWISVRLFSELQRHAEMIRESEKSIKVPSLIIHGAADRLTQPKGSKKVGNKLGDDCTVLLWPKVKHHLHETAESGEIFNYIVDWTEKEGVLNVS